jgi:hypothetical protein
MSKSPERFARLLSQAIRQIAWRNNIKIQNVQDEVGYALGRESGGASIEYWRKGHIPAQLSDLELLAQVLIQRSGLVTLTEVEQFLDAADHPQPTLYASSLLPEGLSASSPLAAHPSTNLEDQALSLEAYPAFIVGPPITQPHCFFGRGRECKRIFGLLSRRPLQNTAIIGPRRSGKTSLLYYLKNITTAPAAQLRPDQFQAWLPVPEKYRWLLVDFHDTRLSSREGLLRYLLSGLNLPIPVPCTLERFLDIISQNLRQPTVILLDEIGVALQRYPELDEAFWEGLRALATHQVEGNLAFILAAPEPPAQLAQHSDLGSPFFNMFGYTAFLGPLEETEALALIGSSPVPFTEAEVSWILAQSGRWPLLLQILCRERLMAWEEGETSLGWQEEALRQIDPFRHLLAGKQ